MVRIVVAGLALALLVPAEGGAAVRAVAPGGDPFDPVCAASAPCDLRHAVEDVAEPGDEVQVAPGTYQGTLRVGTPVHLRGTPGAARPLLVAAGEGPGPLVILPAADGAVVEDLDLRYDGTRQPAVVVLGRTVLDRLTVTVTGSGATAVSLGYGSLLRDSAISAFAADAVAVAVDAGDYGLRRDVRHADLRNVSAVAPAAGGVALLVRGGARGEFCEAEQLDALATVRSSILLGGAADVRAEAGCAPGTPVRVELATSIWRPTATVAAGAAADVVNVIGNLDAPPGFVDVASGDLHLASGSPAIDAGSVDERSGALDLDGDPRSLGAAPDIGADERVPPPVQPAVPPGGGPRVPSGLRPSVDGLRVVPARFAAARTAHRRGVPVGTTFRLVLSRPATVRLTFRRRVPCPYPTTKRPTAAGRVTGCGVQWRTLPQGLAAFRSAGARAIPFAGWLGGAPLAPGAYAVRAVAVDSRGHRSAAAVAPFTIVGTSPD